MNKKEIKNIAASTISFYLPENQNWEIGTQTILKNNDCEIDAISVGYNGISALIHVDDLYQHYCSCNDLDEVLRTAATRVAKEIQELNFNAIESLLNFNQAKDKIVSFIINTDSNRQILASSPHRDIEDLSIIYCAMVDNSATGFATTQISNALMERWGIGEEELYELSSINNKRLLPPMIKSMTELMMEMASEMCLPYIDCYVPPMYVITNQQKTRGAIYMFDTDVLTTAATMIGARQLYIFPSSIHEGIVIDAEMIDREYANHMVVGANIEAVSEQEFLGDHAYVFDLKTKTISSI